MALVAYWVIEATKDGVEVEDHIPIFFSGCRTDAEALCAEISLTTSYGWCSTVEPRPLTRAELAEEMLQAA